MSASLKRKILLYVIRGIHYKRLSEMKDHFKEHDIDAAINEMVADGALVLGNGNSVNVPHNWRVDLESVSIPRELFAKYKLAETGPLVEEKTYIPDKRMYACSKKIYNPLSLDFLTKHPGCTTEINKI